VNEDRRSISDEIPVKREGLGEQSEGGELNSNIHSADAKVFIIGLNKTGTTFMGDLLSNAGLRVEGYSGAMLMEYRQSGFTDLIKDHIRRFDAFQDLPWPFMYKHLVNAYPDALFILTTRSSKEVWYNSIRRHSLTLNPFHSGTKWAYGLMYPNWHRGEFEDAYERHNQGVIDAVPSERLLLVNIDQIDKGTITSMGRFLHRELAMSLERVNGGDERLAQTNLRMVLLNRLFQLLHAFERPEFGRSSNVVYRLIKAISGKG